MIFERDSKYEGYHAILSASQNSWLNYETEEQFFNLVRAKYAPVIGTALHELAKKLIEDGQRLKKNGKCLAYFYLRQKKIPKKLIDIDIWYEAFMTYVNDAIMFKMTPEIPMFYTDFAGGTTDCISFDGKLLRIHDLKTGVTPAKMEQLEVYAAYFCLWKKIKPHDIDIELRIYQADQILSMKPDADEIYLIIQKIIDGNTIISRILAEEE